MSTPDFPDTANYAHTRHSQDPTVSLESILLVSLVGIYVVYKLLESFGLPIHLWLSPLLRMAWNSFVYLVPARVAFALDSSGPVNSLSADPNNLKSNPEDMQAAKSEVLQKVFGLDKWGLLKSVQGDRSLRGLSMLLKVGSNDAPPGLGNWDNSCYQNSVIQGLASLPSLRVFLSMTTSSFTTFSMDTTNGALFDTINKLNDPENHGQRLWTPGKLKSMSSFQQQDAQEYYSKILDELDKEVFKASKQTPDQRAPGLLEARALITKTASEIASPESEEHTITKREPALSVLKPLQNPLDGLLAQRVGCIRCGYTDGLSMIPFNCLTVPLGKDWIYDIRDCLDEYTKLEPIEGVECAKCTLLRTKETLTGLIDGSSVAGSTMPEILRKNITSRLQTVEEALEEDDFADNTLIKKCQVPKKNWMSSTKSRQAVIARSPKSLVIHVNRSVFDEFTGAQMKNYADVKFPKDLDLGPWCLGSRPSHSQELHEESPEEWSKDPTKSMLGPIDEEFSEPSLFQYKLRAVVTHYGRHENGHYVCYRKHTFTASMANAPEPSEELSSKDKTHIESNEGWWRLSDEDVTRVSEEGVLRQGGVFMLFYERSEIEPSKSVGEACDLKVDSAASDVVAVPLTSVEFEPATGERSGLGELDPVEVPLPNEVGEGFFSLESTPSATHLPNPMADTKKTNNESHPTTASSSSKLQGSYPPQEQMNPTANMDQSNPSEPDGMINDPEDTSSTLFTSEDDAASESYQEHFELPSTNTSSINSLCLMKTAGASGNRHTDGTRSSLLMVAAT